MVSRIWSKYPVQKKMFGRPEAYSVSISYNVESRIVVPYSSVLLCSSLTKHPCFHYLKMLAIYK